jgi:hypothetical protein
MVNFKKMDEKDFVFVNKSPDEKEEKAFSDFLKTRKMLANRAIKRRKKVRTTKKVP